ncbi:hypothetical protein CPB84DRAFT_1822728 [Gymnopilus junonius]|uniref:Uncharacterized protein n=1 Tax=Gymnopilus junonius TaxID=109634 RepID=A0A9P5NU47_GYMJU|nr:hypothetical protein CPB84DRAFT_1822728 [Gymnopilus junonius]
MAESNPAPGPTAREHKEKDSVLWRSSRAELLTESENTEHIARLGTAGVQDRHTEKERVRRYRAYHELEARKPCIEVTRTLAQVPAQVHGRSGVSKEGAKRGRPTPNLTFEEKHDYEGPTPQSENGKERARGRAKSEGRGRSKVGRVEGGRSSESHAEDQREGGGGTRAGEESRRKKMRRTRQAGQRRGTSGTKRRITNEADRANKKQGVTDKGDIRITEGKTK